MRRFGHSKALNVTTDQTEQMERLNRWRNDFLHWKPVGWNIEVRGYAEMIETCLGVAEFLAFECVETCVETYSSRVLMRLPVAAPLLSRAAKDR
jgi:hypothetical protein